MTTVASGVRPILAVALLAAAAACKTVSFGPRVSDFEPARSGAGVVASVMLPDRTRFAGELLAVRDDGMLVLTGEPAIVHVTWRAVRHATFHQMSQAVSHGTTPTPDDFETLRLVSRYPEGLDDARLRTLLDAYGLADVRREDS